MILAQLAYRAWALAGGWFLIDDYGFLADVAVRDRLTLEWLFHIHNDHLQPLGFLIVWVVGHSTPFDWGLSTVITLVMQALASVAAFVFLLRLGGRRWCTLVPLGFYLFSVITLPGFLWWCVSMMQVPQQFAAFTAMALHVEYIRTRRSRYVWLTALTLAFGMLCDVKIAFVALALVFLSLYLSDVRGAVRRVLDALWRQRLAWIVYGTIFVAYLALYLHLNPATDLAERQAPDRVGVFEVMARYTLAPTILGGPWKWGQMTDTPLVPAQPPEWAVTITWVVLALLTVWAVRRRPSTAWALVFVLGCLVVNVLMVATARGAIFGKVLGLEVRYLGDLAPSLTLAVAVIAMGLAPTSARPPAPPAVDLDAPVRRRPLAIGAVLVVGALVGSFVSSAAYIANWHSDYPARAFVQNVIRQTEQGPLVILDKPVPLSVIPRDEVVNAFERPSQLFLPLGDKVLASLQGNDLLVLDDEGTAHLAGVLPELESMPGPDGDCGYRVDDGTTTIQMVPATDRPQIGDFWWGSVAYLASDDGTAELGVGGTEVEFDVERGLHTFIFLGNGAPDDVVISADDGLVMCVDKVRIGDVVPLDGGDS